MLTTLTTIKKEEKDEQARSFSDRLFRRAGAVGKTSAQAQRVRTSEDTTRLTITLANSTVEAIELLADEMSLSESAVVNFLVGKGLVIEAVQSEGGIVQILMPNGEMLRLKDFGKGGRTTQDMFVRLVPTNGDT